MPKISAAEVAGIVATAGGPPAGTTVAEWVAKSRQESSHDTTAVSPTGCCHGLWQINVGKHMDKINAVSREDAISIMRSPLRNWYVARLIYAEAGGWSPWAASGGRPIPIAEDLAAAGAPDRGTAGSGGGDPGEAIPGVGPINPIDDVTDFLSGIFDPVMKAVAWLGNPGNWVRVVQVGGGIALGIVAVGAILKPAAQEVVSTVGKVK
jgi:hypothetical protein